MFIGMFPFNLPSAFVLCGSRLKDQGWYPHSAVADFTSKSQSLVFTIISMLGSCMFKLFCPCVKPTPSGASCYIHSPTSVVPSFFSVFFKIFQDDGWWSPSFAGWCSKPEVGIIRDSFWPPATPWCNLIRERLSKFGTMSVGLLLTANGVPCGASLGRICRSMLLIEEK